MFFEFAKLVHDAIGIESPRTFVLVFALFGMVLFGGIGWLIDRSYRVQLTQQPADSAARSGEGTPETRPPPRHLTPEQASLIKEALEPFEPQMLGIVTLTGKSERIAFAKQLEDAFIASSWSVTRYCVDRFEHDRSSVMIVRHTQGNMPDVAPLRAALAAARIPHPEVSVGPTEYPTYTAPCDPNAQHPGWNHQSGISTSELIIFVGPRIEMPAYRFKEF